MSLRLRLVVGLAALVVLGLAAFGAGTYVALDRFLVGRLDQQLSTAATSVARMQRGGHRGGGPEGFGDGFGGDSAIRNSVAPDLFVEVLAADGSVLTTVDAPTGEAGPPGTVSRSLLSSIHAGPTQTSGPDPDGHVGAGAGVVTPRLLSFTVRGHGRERAAITAAAGSANSVLVAGSLRPVETTLHRLLAIEAGVGAAVLGLTLLLGSVLARQATAPLEAIAETADGITAGDMERRVPVTEEHTEVGRVGVALNAMLNEIAQAFARRDATEARLRRFVADASHELSTPLTSIRGYAELFHRGMADRPDDLAKAMARIEAEGARMGGLVDDLLLLASLDSGRPLRQDPVDLARIAADAAADLGAAAPDRPITLDAPEPVIVLGDEDRLRQVAANLTSNARRHTPAGTVVTLRSRQVDGFGWLEVADAGPGLDADAAAHVFDRFYRVDTARARRHGGAGLGLSIVATIAEQLGGRAWLETAAGQGATFAVSVPLARVVPDEAGEGDGEAGGAG